MNAYQNRITLEPGKRGGRPFIRGLRITVYDVLDWMAQGMSEQQIIEDYPELSVEDIRACLAFAARREHQVTAVHGAG
jgi:uncharacterized protein (DUF433 family)